MQHFLRSRPNGPNKYSLWTNDVKQICINSKKGVDYLKLANLTESATEPVTQLSTGSKVLLGNAMPDIITKLYQNNSPWMLK